MKDNLLKTSNLIEVVFTTLKYMRIPVTCLEIIEWGVTN
jgi:hypothetical protein